VLIHDIYELQNMSMDLNGSYVLANDIDAFDSYKMNDNHGFLPVGNESNSYYNSTQQKRVYPNGFQGDFDGKGFSIAHLYGGLFGVASETANITDVTVSIGQMGQAFAGIAGTNYGTISRCSVSGTVSKGSALVSWNYGMITDCQSSIKMQGSWNTSGGIAGENRGTIFNCSFNGSLNNSYGGGAGGVASFNMGKIVNCYSSGLIASDRWIGGIAGRNTGEITGCFNRGQLIGHEMVGGVVGVNFGQLRRCFSNGTAIWGLNLTGGFVGWNSGRSIGMDVRVGTIDECANIGPVIGNESTGGFAGGNMGVINNSYNLGRVNGGNWTGGFLGYFGQVYGQSGTGMGNLTNCYNAGQVTSTAESGGFIGKRTTGDGNLTGGYYEDPSLNTSGGANGKTKEDMMRKATFAGWDFNNIWRIDENVSYPSLRFVDVGAQGINHNPMITTHPFFFHNIDGIALRHPISGIRP
jgi:hypothetical protein